MFEDTGNVEAQKGRHRDPRWPEEVVSFTKTYAKEHPCFYIEELQNELKKKFPLVENVSQSTICRALRFDLGLSRKILTKKAREACSLEVLQYVSRLRYLYRNPDQLVFVDETSKDGRSAYRRRAWSSIGKAANVKIPFARGKRVSVFAALNINGFIGWDVTEGTFNRKTMHKSMVKNVIPLLNPYPLPNSILVIDNARIHMYQEWIDAVHKVGAIVVFLSPYSPHLNPIEFCFGSLKRWIQKHANVVFASFPTEVLKVAMVECTKNESLRNHGDLIIDKNKGIAEKQLLHNWRMNGNLKRLFAHCGYGSSDLIREAFE
jgi:hypothetical protein